VDPRLVGIWVNDPEDASGQRAFGRVTLEFGHDGRLVYTIHGDEKDEKMLLTYSVDQGYLVTDQPSSPREERTAYSLREDGRLELNFGGKTSLYIRSQ
jgi:hypothetical protein